MLGRVGLGRREQRTHVYHWRSNGTTRVHSSQRLLHHRRRHQSASLAQDGQFLSEESAIGLCTSYSAMSRFSANGHCSSIH